MNNIKSKKVINALPLIAIFILLFAGTYAKYSFAGNTKTEAEVAKWNVQITNDSKDLTLEDTQNIEFKVLDNPNVVNGKIAPGSTAVATIDVDLVGTEVAVDLKVDVDKQNLQYEKFSVVTKVDGEVIKQGETKLFELQNDKAFTEENGKKVITIELKWENDDDNSEIDSTMGIEGSEISVPVKVTVRQHIK